MIRFWLASLVVAVLLVPQQPPAAERQLSPTAHPPVSENLQDLWLVPSELERKKDRRAVYTALANAVEAFGAGDFSRAETLASSEGLSSSELAEHAAYYEGLAQLKASKATDARSTFAGIRARKPAGYVSLAASLGEAQAAEASGDFAAAVAIYEALAADKVTVGDDLLLRLGRAALGAGDRRKAAAAFLRTYYEYPLSESAVAAKSELDRLKDVTVRSGAQADLGRAAVHFGARRYTDARTAYLELRGRVSGEDHEVVELRLAECDYFLGRYKVALTALEPWRDKASRKAEVRFFMLSALREMGRHEEYIAETRALVADFPDSSWSEEALNNLGTHFILQNEDEAAAEVFREQFAKFPTGARAERAAWKHGWWAYKNGEHAEAIRVFEATSRNFPRSDYRPSFLYWAGRSHEKLGAAQHAEARLRLVFTDYGNSYYGRLAVRQLPSLARTDTTADARPATHVPASATGTLPSAVVTQIRLLLSNGLYDDAMNELRFAQRAWENSARIEATLAWAYNRKGELRRAITLMRRAYPQFLTANGHWLPTEILEIIYPLAHWELIQKHAKARKLDPYLVAALIGQESTFDPKARSVANAWGLMQIVPATGRRLARSLGIRRFRTAMLTNPEININLGTLYFSRLVEQFGGVHYALASYNAGESRVVRWKAERPGIEQDEFIDDIPFPETQNYVKRILGTAEDYRALYGKGNGKPIRMVER